MPAGVPDPPRSWSDFFARFHRAWGDARSSNPNYDKRLWGDLSEFLHEAATRDGWRPDRLEDAQARRQQVERFVEWADPRVKSRRF